jgi:PAS domain S-box-containing protein
MAPQNGVIAARISLRYALAVKLRTVCGASTMDVAANDAAEFWRSRASQFMLQPFAIAVAQSAIPTLIADLESPGFPIIFANASFGRLLGWDELEVLGRSPDLFHADPGAPGRVAAAVARGEIVSDDFVLIRKDGSLLSVRIDMAPLFDPRGRPSLLFATLVDVSDRVKAERGLGAAERQLEERTAAFATAIERSELMSREITPRTKNALAILAAIVATKARRAATAAEAALLDDIVGRIRSIGGLQSLLDGVKSEEDGIVLRDFLARLVADLDRSTGARVVLADVPHLKLPSDTALSVALCVTELVLNALKHGLTDGGTGTVTVSARVADGRCTVVVEDDGVGLGEGFDPAASEGLGMQVLLDQTGKIGGTVTCGRGSAGGARFEIDFPG